MEQKRNILKQVCSHAKIPYTYFKGEGQCDKMGPARIQNIKKVWIIRLWTVVLFYVLCMLNNENYGNSISFVEIIRIDFLSYKKKITGIIIKMEF